MIEEFIEGLLPGNYALTKSMELTKKKTSGTLWYTKKFLVLYYYIFLSPDINTRGYIDKVVRCFDRFIHSLDEKIRDDAEEFFFPKDSIFNLKSKEYKAFDEFVQHTGFKDEEEKKRSFDKAKKVYFMNLMDVGGQTGTKKKVKEKSQCQNFVYSKENMESILLNAVIEVCVEQVNKDKKIKDNSVTVIIDEKIVNKLEEIAVSKVITKEEVIYLINNSEENPFKYHSIENDMVAFIRNERQILYYYGYFHSKTLGANDYEFSSLTPVGEIAILANFYEFLSIWEHQKIKMISQPPMSEITKLPLGVANADQFSISYNPYVDILGCVIRNGKLTFEEYKYIVSRRCGKIKELDWEVSEQSFKSDINKIKCIITAFKRKADNKDEDFRKELLKYTLGIMHDMKLDKESNPIGILKCENSEWSVVEEKKMVSHNIYNVYKRLADYKCIMYSELFNKCQNDLKKRYKKSIKGESLAVDKNIKIEWDLYNIRIDPFILLATIYTISITEMHKEYDISDIAIVDEILKELETKYDELLKSLGLKTRTKRRDYITKLQQVIINEDYTILGDKEKYETQVDIAKYRENSSLDLMEKIQQVSLKREEEEGRNTNLIGMIKSYYINTYLEDETLRCECCGEAAFKTKANEPYLEFHHLIPFKIANGPDHYLNLVGLCANCHRKIHYTKNLELRPLYQGIDNNNMLEKTIYVRAKELKAVGILKSYHLEYLLSQGAITDDEYGSILNG